MVASPPTCLHGGCGRLHGSTASNQGLGPTHLQSISHQRPLSTPLLPIAATAEPAGESHHTLAQPGPQAAGAAALLAHFFAPPRLCHAPLQVGLTLECLGDGALLCREPKLCNNVSIVAPSQPGLWFKAVALLQRTAGRASAQRGSDRGRTPPQCGALSWDKLPPSQKQVRFYGGAWAVEKWAVEKWAVEKHKIINAISWPHICKGGLSSSSAHLAVPHG